MINNETFKRLCIFFFKTILYSLILLGMLYIYVFVVGGAVPDFVYTEF